LYKLKASNYFILLVNDLEGNILKSILLNHRSQLILKIGDNKKEENLEEKVLENSFTIHSKIK
jgi:hypothetical protein